MSENNKLNLIWIIKNNPFQLKYHQDPLRVEPTEVKGRVGITMVAGSK
jgi:hypothetical protein